MIPTVLAVVCISHECQELLGLMRRDQPILFLGRQGLWRFFHIHFGGFYLCSCCW
jgi:hypothetical protein